MRSRRWQGRGRWMRVAVTFSTQAEHKRRENENNDSLFRGSEEEFLSGLIEFETPAPFHLSACFFCRGRTRTER